MKSITEHIYEHPFAIIIHGPNNKWYSLRPLGESDYWIEAESGEGMGVNQKKLFMIIDKFYRENF